MTKWSLDRYKYHYTYITRCSVNGKYYKGRHSSNRLDDHYLGSSLELRKDISRYGTAAFTREVVAVYPTAEESWLAEVSFITEADVASELCYNKTVGGKGPERFTEARRKEISEKQRAWVAAHGSQRKGKKASEQTLAAIRAYHARPDVKAHERDIKLGELNPMYGVRGFEHPTSKPVMCMETGKIYGSAMQAAAECGCSFQNLSKVCKGERHTCAGRHWRFVAPEELASSMPSGTTSRGRTS